MIVNNAYETAAVRNGEVTLPASTRLSVRTPDEILAMTFDDTDCILGDRLLAKGQPLTILGAGGIGKSRLLLQLAACCISGRRFLNIETHSDTLRWLIIQAENSNRRLKDDLTKLREWLGADWAKVSAQLHIHTLEKEDDSFLSLDTPENQEKLKELIGEFMPDVVGFDTLNNFCIGDPNADRDMRETCQSLSQLVKAGNPDRALVVLHHAITGKAGAIKATGYDRASFGRNSKVLQAWTRGQINIAPGSSEDNSRLIVSCGKCSNGKEFPTFAIQLDQSTMIYNVDESFDLATWEADIGGKKEQPSLSIETVKSFWRPDITKRELAKALMDDTGCGRTHAYNKIKAAERSRAIRIQPYAKH